MLVGLTFTDGFVPKELDHEYVPPPLAVNVVLSPLHISTVAGLIVTVGLGFTVT